MKENLLIIGHLINVEKVLMKRFKGGNTDKTDGVMRKKQKKNNYIDGLKEWQEHQYTPGYYLGGKIPHYFFNRKPNILGLSFLLLGVIEFIVFAFSFVQIFYGYYDSLIGSIIFLLFSVIQILVGIKLLQKPRKRGKNSSNNSLR